MIQLTQFTVNMFGESTFVVSDPATRQAIIVDPGMYDPQERDMIERFIRDNNLTLTQIVNTHMHIDHLFGANHLKATHGVKLAAGAADAPLGQAYLEQGMRFGLPALGDPVTVDIELADGDTVDVGSYKLHVLAVPGHSPGSIALYSPDGHWVITGDALFKGSVGRTDLPGGNHAQLVRSIEEKLLTLPDDTVVYPGHGPSTTIGEERQFNPFL